MSSERFKTYEQHAEVLRRIAKNYGEDSVETTVLKQASLVLCFALTEKYVEFAKYTAETIAPLTQEQQQQLKKLGLMPE